MDRKTRRRIDEEIERTETLSRIFSAFLAFAGIAFLVAGVVLALLNLR